MGSRCTRDNESYNRKQFIRSEGLNPVVVSDRVRKEAAYGFAIFGTRLFEARCFLIGTRIR